MSVDLGLYDDLDEDSKQLALQNAEKELIKKKAFDVIKNLEEDYFTIQGQKFCVITWVGPSFRAKTSIYGFRIMGAFGSYSDACRYVGHIHSKDPTFDVGVVEMNLWTFCYPNDEVITEMERDAALNEFIVEHKRNIEISRQYFEIRRGILKNSKKTKEIDKNVGELPQGKTTKELKEKHKNWAKTLEEEKPEKKPEETFKDFNENSYDHVLNGTCPKIVNQEFAVVSFVGHSGNNKRIPMCIKGVFESLEAAENHIKKIIEFDNTYDLLPCQMYNWVPCDPDIKKLRHVYKEQKLNELLEQDEIQRMEAARYHTKVENGDDDLGDPIKKTETGVFIEEPEVEIMSMDKFIDHSGKSYTDNSEQSYTDNFPDHSEQSEANPGDLLDKMDGLISTYSFQPDKNKNL